MEAKWLKGQIKEVAKIIKLGERAGKHMGFEKELVRSWLNELKNISGDKT